jgi:hypothetical protein
MDQILEAIQKLDKKVSGIDQRLTNLEGGFKYLEKRFSDYIDKDSKIQENIVEKDIYTILHNNCNMANIKYINIKEFYSPYKSDPLSEFDGCIHISNFSMNPKLLFTNTNNDRIKTPIKLKNNSQYISDRFKINSLFIIEAKHSFDKTKIDKKLLQYYNILTIFQNMDVILQQNTNIKFQDMFNNFFKDIYKNLDIHTIFASDYITQTINNYLYNINIGMTESVYNNLSYQMMREDKYLKQEVEKKEDIQTKVINKKTGKEDIQKTTKFILSEKSIKSFRSAKNIKEIQKLFMEPEFMKPVFIKLHNTVAPYMTTYNDLKDVFSSLKGRISILYQNNIITTNPLLQKENILCTTNIPYAQ